MTDGHGDKADQQRCAHVYIYIYSPPEKEGAFRGVGIRRLHYLGLAALEDDMMPGRVGGGPVPEGRGTIGRVSAQQTLWKSTHQMSNRQTDRQTNTDAGCSALCRPHGLLFPPRSALVLAGCSRVWSRGRGCEAAGARRSVVPVRWPTLARREHGHTRDRQPAGWPCRSGCQPARLAQDTAE